MSFAARPEKAARHGQRRGGRPYWTASIDRRPLNAPLFRAGAAIQRDRSMTEITIGGRLIALSTALFGLALPSMATAPSASPNITVTATAEWAIECGASRIEQFVEVENKEEKAWCMKSTPCGGNLLLNVRDQKGEMVAFGFSCGRTQSGDRSAPSDIGILFPNVSRTIGYSNVASEFLGEEGPPINLSRAKTYTGSGKVTLYKCEDLLARCGTGQCRSEVPVTTLSFSNVAIKYAGERPCGKPRPR